MELQRRGSGFRSGDSGKNPELSFPMLTVLGFPVQRFGGTPLPRVRIHISLFDCRLHVLFLSMHGMP